MDAFAVISRVRGRKYVVIMILAFCGIDCAKCPCYVATRNGDEEELSELVKVWSSSGDSYEAEDLVCDGCYGPRISKDCKVCWIRECVASKKVTSCAYCEDYPCERLEKDWGSWKVLSGAEAKARLDRLRSAPA
jgi:hypothetical protein